MSSPFTPAPGANHRSVEPLNLATVRRRSRMLNDTCRALSKREEGLDAEPRSNWEGLKDILLGDILKVPMPFLLCFVPAAFASVALDADDSWAFWLNFAALIPLAKILGDATEELAANLKNDMLSGLLNATFGNAVEMIMTVAFLGGHQYLVVKTTLLGSMLSNMLLVLGTSFLAGGLVKTGSRRAAGAGGESRPELQAALLTDSHKEPPAFKDRQQEFTIIGALVNTSMLLLSCLVLCLVTVFTTVDGMERSGTSSLRQAEEARRLHKDILPISRLCSCLILVAYLMYLVFQLFTHRDAMGEDSGDDDEEPNMDLKSSLGLLFVTTLIVAACSEFLTDALEGALRGSSIGKSFLGIILLPIVGNACEHAAAVRFAVMDRPGLSVGIAVGSSVQVALFVTPLSVLLGWLIGGDPATGSNMDLNFGVLDVTVLTLSVIVILSIVVDGKSNWLEGYMLVTAYAIIGVLYWYRD